MVIVSTSGKRLHETTGLLPGSDLSRLELTAARFDALDLGGADLSGAQLVSASFDDARASLHACIGANMEGAHLMGACFDGADLTDADLYWSIHRARRSEAPDWSTQC